MDTTGKKLCHPKEVVEPLRKNQLKFNKAIQNQDTCREKQASNKNVNNFITGFFALIFNALAIEKGMLFLPGPLLL